MKNNIDALMITGGHAFDQGLFFAMVKSLDGQGENKINWTFLEHPHVETTLDVEYGSQFDVIVFYDMPGVIFTGNRENPIEHFDPSEEFKTSFIQLVENGVGLVFLHHAIGGWPTWKEYGEMIGGKFDFRSYSLRDKRYPGSAYRFNVEQNMTLLNRGRAIVRGFPETFNMKEEVYLYAVLEEEVVPLISSDFDFNGRNFRYGGEDFKKHPEGSNLIAWVKAHGKSPVAYVQPGHGPDIFLNTEYHKLLNNSIQWAASAIAKEWAIKMKRDQKIN